MKKNLPLVILQITAFIIMIAVNALANILPINGLNTGEVSAFYPNYFVPAGFTFSIWGIIYLLLAVYLFASTQLLLKKNNDATKEKMSIQVAKIFIGTCILNASWIFAWHYLQVLASVFIMLLFLFTLTIMYIKQQQATVSFTPFQQFAIHIPFVVYLAWICVATIANITALLVSIGFNGIGVEPTTWSICMIIVATLLAIYFGIKEKQWAFCAIISWALYGILQGQKSSSYAIGLSATICMVVVLIATVIATYDKKKSI